MSKVSYIGESSRGYGDRFALVSCEANEKQDTETILNRIGYSYDGFGDEPDGSMYYYVKVESAEDYRCFMEEWKKEKTSISAFNKVKEQYNSIMYELGYEYKTIGNEWSDCTEEWNERDMVAECDAILSTFYESGHSNEALRNSDNAEDKAFWRKSVNKLCRFVSKYKPLADNMICNGYHNSSKYDNALLDMEDIDYCRN